MASTDTLAPVSKGSLWTGRIISGLVVLFMLFDCITKITRIPQVIEASARVGVNAHELFWIGVTLLICVILYVIPKTSVFGAILLAGYLGGAVCANVLSHQPVFNSCFAIAFGLLTWLGLYLREPRLQALVPFKG
ncbi:MAG TPA: DoxX family protein [Candidatus Acidoferrales bacterium]|nr:DoxX family protein [Candidatus Acidoferrales bacterium]